MDAERFQRVAQLFDEAWNLPAPQRPAFLDSRCGADRTLRCEVEALLKHADDSSANVHLSSVNRAMLGALEESSAPPQQVGRYRIIRELGRGGMGVVYLAEQENPRREVALKVIRPGLATPEATRRFIHEAQVLARLHHPGIAQIFEAGMTSIGTEQQPYFAMEYVEGTSLGEFLQRGDLSIRDRLRLMIQVCDAVQHAHQRGVIHRDLKPGNILVSDESKQRRTDDEKGGAGLSVAASLRRSVASPKVLDFGVARITDADFKLTVQTSVGQIVGTLAYMAPEQMEGDPLAIDTRCDVYALGVILYQMLAGRLPHDTGGKSVHEAIRIVTQIDPPPLASQNAALRGDLETIVHKAIEKSPAQRYVSAAELGADLQRYLDDEPIAARRPTLTYQLRKFARRNRALVIGAGIAVVALLVATVATTWTAIEATRQREIAVKAFDDSEKQRKIATAALSESEKQRNIAEATNHFLNVDVLGGFDPIRPTGTRDLLLSDVLDRVEKKIDGGALSDRPEVRAAVHNTLGYMSRHLGRTQAAADHHRKSLELNRELFSPNHAHVGVCMNNLGEVLSDLGNLAEALPMLREARRIILDKIGPQSREAAGVANNLSTALMATGNVAEAEALLTEAIEAAKALPPGDAMSRPVMLNTLANIYRDTRRFDEAIPLYQESLAALRQSMGGRHPLVALLLNNLGLTYKLKRDLAAAEPLYRESLDIRREVLPPKHTSLGESLINLAALLRDQGKCDQAEPLLREAVELLDESAAGSWQPQAARGTLGGCLMLLKQFPEAESVLKHAEDALAAMGPPAGPLLKRTQEALAKLYEAWEKAEPDAGYAAKGAEYRALIAPQSP